MFMRLKYRYVKYSVCAFLLRNSCADQGNVVEANQELPRYVRMTWRGWRYVAVILDSAS